MMPVLYPANTTDFTTFGLGTFIDTIYYEVTEERNGLYECLLQYPITGQHYGLIAKECIVKVKPNDTSEPQAFRIYRITKPLGGIVTVYAQHISYDLANVPVLPFEFDSRSPTLILEKILAGDSRYTGWTDYSEAKPFSVTQPKSVRACLGGTEGSMLSKWYGEFEWDNFTVKLHKHRGQKTGGVIEYGKNLTDIEQDEDNHEAIIDRDTFMRVQHEIERRARLHKHKTAPLQPYEFSGKVVWICSTFNRLGKAHCPSQQIPEEILKRVIGDKEFCEIHIPCPNTIKIVQSNGNIITEHWQNPSRSESWTDEMKQMARERRLHG